MGEHRHYDPTNDLVFKFVFGREERKNITLKFINDMTGREGDRAFVDLDFRNGEFAPTKVDEKLGRLDVFGILNDKSRVDIEMQVINHMNMEKRALFYWAQMYLHFEALQTGQAYRQIKPAISINILRFPYLPTEEPFSKYGIYNIENGHHLSNDLEIDFLEIPKYKDKPVKDMTRIERWLAYFANRLAPAEKEELAMQAPEIKDAMEASDRFLMDDKAYWEYIQRESAIWDYNSDVLDAKEQAKEEGRAWGLEEGRKQGIEQGIERGIEQGIERGIEQGEGKIVLNLLKAGQKVSVVEQLSGWSRQRILSYAEEHGVKAET